MMMLQDRNGHWCRFRYQRYRAGAVPAVGLDRPKSRHLAPVRPQHCWTGQPVGDRHTGRSDQSLHDAAAPARRLHPKLVRDAWAAKIKTLSEVLRASMTSDQGPAAWGVTLENTGRR